MKSELEEFRESLNLTSLILPITPGLRHWDLGLYLCAYALTSVCQCQPHEVHVRREDLSMGRTHFADAVLSALLSLLSRRRSSCSWSGRWASPASSGRGSEPGRLAINPALRQAARHYGSAESRAAIDNISSSKTCKVHVLISYLYKHILSKKMIIIVSRDVRQY